MSIAKVRAFLAVVTALAGIPAAASEQARVSVLGFSRDGSSFAFEQFGIAGPEGHPYSDLQILDSMSGLPVAGAPFRTTFAKRAPTPDVARSVTYNAAQRTITRLGIGELGTVLARGSGDYTDPSAVEVPITIDTIGSGTLRIVNGHSGDKTCAKMKIDAKTLTVDVVDGAGVVLRRLVSEPKIPPERFCPMGYALVEVRVLPREGKPPVVALLLARTGPSLNGINRSFQAHVIDLSAEPIATEEKKGGH